MSETQEYVASVQLCDRSWFGHPERERISESYQRAKDAAGDPIDGGFPWSSGLRCWHLMDAEGNRIGRVFEPTAMTPHWVWTNDTGSWKREPMVDMDRLTQLMVEYRLRGGADL